MRTFRVAIDGQRTNRLDFEHSTDGGGASKGLRGLISDPYVRSYHLTYIGIISHRPDRRVLQASTAPPLPPPAVPMHARS